MNFFKRKKPTQPQLQMGFVPIVLPKQGDALPASLKAHSKFIKRVNCSQCGAPKSLPSVTAYIYCDYCGSLMDYDFRLANANTNAGLTNTVFHRLVAVVQGQLAQAKAQGNRDMYRLLYRHIFSEWIKECPMAVSPRAKNDPEFRAQMVAYLAECLVTKDLDPQQQELNQQMDALTASLQRTPTPGGAWKVSGPFWEYAALFKKQMEIAYALIRDLKVDQMDPDHAAPEVALRMEYSTFCQAWLPHLSTEEGERLLKFYGLSGEYDELQPLQMNHHQCGACGSDMQTLQGARQVVCDSCGFPIDVGSQPLPCQKCGAQLSMPVSADHVLCPYCKTDNRRV